MTVTIKPPEFGVLDDHNAAAKEAQDRIELKRIVTAWIERELEQCVKMKAKDAEQRRTVAALVMAWDVLMRPDPYATRCVPTNSDVALTSLMTRLGLQR